MTSIFTRIIRKELPGHFVWEDEQCVAIMTIHPVRAGHLMVIPRDEVDHWDDLDPEVAAHLMRVSQRIARVQKRVYGCARIGLIIAGLEVPHTHLHLIPTDAMSDLDFSRAVAADADTLAREAERIRAALP